MTYLPDLHTYLHQSSLLIQAYPTARITTKYSLPRKPTPKQLAKRQQQQTTQTTSADPSSTAQPAAKEKREPSATLTLKTFDAESGICLKYRTDKAAEVGRLMSGLGRLAKGEVIEMPSVSAAPAAAAAAVVDEGDKMVVDAPVAASVSTAVNGGGSGEGGGKAGKRRGGKR